MTTQIILIVLLIGVGAGVLSGLVGVGGGIILVPALVFALKYTQQQAQGTSLVLLTFPVTIVASIYYYYQCQRMGTPIDFKMVGLLAAGFLVGGFFGSKLALSIPEVTLKKIFAIILFYTAIKMIGWDSLFIKWVKGLSG